MVEIKPAATILLARDNNETLEILLLKRNKALAFAGGLWVFPGGKIDPIEMEQGEDEMAAAKTAAIRETKEEANLDILQDNLIFFRHWTTPLIQPRRYATYFFYAIIDKTNSKVQIDDGEIKEHIWIRPEKAINKFIDGELAMLPPTLLSLHLIQNFKSAAEAQTFLKNEPIVYTVPVLNMEGTKMVSMYEGDAGYKNGDIKAIGPRHRLTLDMQGGKYLFEFKNCPDDVDPVTLV